MQYKVFRIPLSEPEHEQEVLNSFLRSHKIIQVRTDLLESEAYSFLVEYMENGNSGKSKSPRIDYREVLPPEQFALFARLREKRKELADEQGVPVYAVFTNEQLAEMAKKPPSSLADLSAIPGIGQARVKNFGISIIETIRKEP